MGWGPLCLEPRQTKPSQGGRADCPPPPGIWKDLKSDELVVKAQIHAGGRGKAGGVKLVRNFSELEKEANKMMGKILVTHQTGPDGKEVKRLYIEEASNIKKEFYLSCLVDRESSKIAFISSTEGGMDIEKVAEEDPKKIVTTKVELNEIINDNEKVNLIKNRLKARRTGNPSKNIIDYLESHS